MFSCLDQRLRVSFWSFAFGLAAIAILFGSNAVAQSTTNCIGMGTGMVHCDTMAMAVPAPVGDGGAMLGQGIGALIARQREMSFRKKIGRMLTSGDCQGAVKFAYEKGRLEVAEHLAASSCGLRPTVTEERR